LDGQSVRLPINLSSGAFASQPSLPGVGAKPRIGGPPTVIRATQQKSAVEGAAELAAKRLSSAGPPAAPKKLARQSMGEEDELCNKLLALFTTPRPRWRRRGQGGGSQRSGVPIAVPVRRDRVWPGRRSALSAT